MFDDPKTRFNQANDPYVTVLSHPITINEIHAAIIGLSGLLFGMVAVTASGEIRFAVNMAVVFLLVYAIVGKPAFHALPHDVEDYEKTVGLKTIKGEPWWWLSTFLPSYLIGRVLAVNGVVA